MELSEARILITGGARGIGNFLALNLLKNANRIFVIDNNKNLLDELPQAPGLEKYLADVTDYAQISSAIENIFTEKGGANVIINNAGIIHSEPLINILSKSDKRHDLTNWKRVIDVNLNSVFYVTSAAVDHMVKRKIQGVIINISSISAQGNIGQSAYAASKAGVEALTKTWSKELGMFKIRSVCLAPGFFNTPSTRESLSEHMLQKWEKAVPLNRLGEFPELLSATEFLIQNDYYNGKILNLDGGLRI